MIRLRIRRTWNGLLANYWFFPVVMLILGILLARIMYAVDTRVPNVTDYPWFIFTGTAVEARAILLGLAGTILGTASVVFSLLTVPLSVAASQFGSRLLRFYLGDRTTQFILGLFVGTFTYLVSVALGIPSASTRPDAPQVAASLGIFLCLISFGSIIVLIDHMGTSLQAPYVVASAGADLLRTLEGFDYQYKIQSKIAAQKKEHPDPEIVVQMGCPIYTNQKGYIQNIDAKIVLALAENHNLIVKNLP